MRLLREQAVRSRKCAQQAYARQCPNDRQPRRVCFSPLHLLRRRNSVLATPPTSFVRALQWLWRLTTRCVTMLSPYLTATQTEDIHDGRRLWLQGHRGHARLTVSASYGNARRVVTVRSTASHGHLSHKCMRTTVVNIAHLLCTDPHLHCGLSNWRDTLYNRHLGGDLGLLWNDESSDSSDDDIFEGEPRFRCVMSCVALCRNTLLRFRLCRLECWRRCQQWAMQRSHLVLR
jgi:hypothetical protein